MATKPLVLPIPIATDADYDLEVWPTGHPLAGQETPWSQKPTKDGAAETAFAPKGWQPGKRVFGPGLNSRGTKIDDMLAWTFAGTPSSSPDTIVERDANGDSAFIGARLEEGPWSRYSHEAAAAWQDAYKVQYRTFAAEGVVPGGGSNNVHDITRPGDDRGFFDAFPSHCSIIFHYDVHVWVGDGDFDPANVAAIFSRSAHSHVLKEGVNFSGGALSSPPADLSFGPALVLFPWTAGTSDRVWMEGQWDLALDGFLYRVVSDVSIRVIELAVP